MEINAALSIPDEELKFTFIRASGPGGQNVNKVATAVQLRFDVLHNLSLPEEVKARLTKLAGSRMTNECVLIIEAKRYRTQDRNLLDAQQRLVALIRKALIEPKKRQPTQPSARSRVKRLDSKKKRGVIKRLRQSISDQIE